MAEIALNFKLFIYLFIMNTDRGILIPENQIKGKVIRVEKLTKLVFCI
jgi:hypothetical protein